MKSDWDELTPRELDVLECAASGYDCKETGLELSIAYETVKFYRKNIFIKLQAKGMPHAIYLACKKGIL